MYVGMHADMRDPQHGDVAHAPAPLGARHGRHVVAVVRRAGDVGGELDDAVVAT